MSADTVVPGAGPPYTVKFEPPASKVHFGKKSVVTLNDAKCSIVPPTGLYFPIITYWLAVPIEEILAHEAKEKLVLRSSLVPDKAI